MVTIRKREGSPLVWARKRPISYMFSHSATMTDDEIVNEGNYVCSIPDETMALYVQTHVEGCHALTRLQIREIEYYLIVWEGVQAWISSKDATLEKIG